MKQIILPIIILLVAAYSQLDFDVEARKDLIEEDLPEVVVDPVELGVDDDDGEGESIGNPLGGGGWSNEEEE